MLNQSEESKSNFDFGGSEIGDNRPLVHSGSQYEYGEPRTMDAAPSVS